MYLLDLVEQPEESDQRFCSHERTTRKDAHVIFEQPSTRLVVERFISVHEDARLMGEGSRTSLRLYSSRIRL